MSKDAGTASLVLRVLRYWTEYRAQAFLLLVAVVIGQAFNTFFAYSMKLFLDHALVQRDEARLIEILVALAVGFVIAAGAGLYAEYLLASVSAKILARLRLRMFERMQSLSMSYYARLESGEVLSRFTSDLADIDKGILSKSSDAISCTFGALINVPLMFAIDHRLTVVTILGLPLIVFGTRIFSSRAIGDKKTLKRVEAQVGTTIQENIRVQPVVKVFTLRDHVVEKFKEQLKSSTSVTIKTFFALNLVGVTSSLAVRFMQIIVLGYGAYLAFHSKLSPGSLVAFVGLHGALSNSVYDFTKKVIPGFLSASPSVARVEELLQEPIEVSDAPDATALDRPKEVRFEDVVFGYEKSTILDGISFDVPFGTQTALVGPSGSGKSTVLKMLMRLHDPQRGKVLFDGIDAKQVTQRSLHGNMAAVFQDTFLFNDTIRANIRMGKLDATDEEIERAAKAAEIHDLIVSLPDGYETRTGELGGRLSGGQRQRIAIARAVLRDPRILILDEATSALDPAAEAAINETLAKLGRDRTVFSVTHRLASAQRADRILVFDKGKLVESGKHDALLKKHGLYFELWTKQAGIEVSPDGRNATIKLERLKAVPLFANMDDEQLQSIESMLVFERHDAGKTIIEKGEIGDKFYILARGKVEAFDPAKPDVPLSTMTDGDFFGEIALQQDVPRSASVRTVLPCSFLTLGQSQFRELVAQSAPMRAAIEEAIKQRLARSSAA